MKIGLVSLGCPKNLVDSEVLLGRLSTAGAEFSSDLSSADVIIINTCGFIEDAKRESIEAILGALETGKKVLVMGCLVERYREDLEKEIPEVEGFFGTQSWDEVLRHLGLRNPHSNNVRLVTTPGSYAYLKIAEGCNRQCSFCAIPSIRGRHRSREKGDLIDEAKFLADQGIKELVVVSQDTTYYGRDLGKGFGLVDLLEELDIVDGIRWIRLLYLYPTEVSDRLIDFISDSEKVLPYFDIPFQHISDRVLKSMRRGYDGLFVRKLIEKIKGKIPQAVLRSTFIVGYPEEGEEDFIELRRFIEEGHFHWAGFFAYSREEGTHAFHLGDPVTEEAKRERINILSEIQDRVTGSYNKELRGQHDVLLEGEEDGKLIGRVWQQAPEIDGVTIFEDSEGLEGIEYEFVKAEIIDTVGTDLVARLLKARGY